MSLQDIKQLNIDFSTQKYVSLDVKQYDRNSRFILVSCYKNGEFLSINNDIYHAYVRYRKADNYGVFNDCQVTKDGKVLIELTEQMLSVAGLSYVDLVIYDIVDISVEVTNNDNGMPQIINTDNTSILSTMTFIVNVVESVFDNMDITSSTEYNALNNLLIEANRDYTNIITYCRQSELNAKESENNAKISEINAKSSENSASLSASNASVSESNASQSEANAKSSEDSSLLYMNNSKSYMDNAKLSENASKESETNALNSANLSKSYAVGSTGVRDNENIDNAMYYYEFVKNVAEGLNGISATVDEVFGYLGI